MGFVREANILDRWKYKFFVGSMGEKFLIKIFSYVI